MWRSIVDEYKDPGSRNFVIPVMSSGHMIKWIEEEEV
jgi:hypothetical protein